MTMQLTPTAQAAAIHRCERFPEKLQYRELSRAFDVVDEIEAKGKGRSYVYACDHCGYFHLSSRNGGTAANIGRRVMTRNSPLYSVGKLDKPVAERDESFLPDGIRDVVTRADVRHALQAHPDQKVVRAIEVAEWSGASRHLVAAELKSLGWHLVGNTRAARWYSPDTAPEDRQAALEEYAAAHQAKSTTVAEPKPAKVKKARPLRLATAEDETNAQLAAKITAQAAAADAKLAAARLETTASSTPKPTPPSPSFASTATGWSTLPHEQLGDMTLDQLVRAYAAVGITVELRMRSTARAR